MKVITNVIAYFMMVGAMIHVIVLRRSEQLGFFDEIIFRLEYAQKAMKTEDKPKATKFCREILMFAFMFFLSIGIVIWGYFHA